MSSGGPRVLHMNFERGLRGGERQAALLMGELARRAGPQRAAVRREGALAGRLRDEAGVEVRSFRNPYVLPRSVCRGIDLVHTHDGRSPGAAALLRLRTGIPFVVTRRILSPPGGDPLTRAAYGSAAAVVGVSRAVAGTMEAYLDRPVHTIRDALPPAEVVGERVESLRRRFQGRFVVGSAAALVSEKGQDVLVDAALRVAEEVEELALVLLGEGPAEASLRERGRGLPLLELPGFQENVREWLHAFDVFVLPSLSEGLGSVLLEAMAAGVPVVGTAVGGIPELVREGESGLLVPPGEPEPLAEAILRLRRDPDLRRRLAEAGRRRAAQETPARMAREYLALYRTVLDGAGRAEGAAR